MHFQLFKKKKIKTLGRYSFQFNILLIFILLFIVTGLVSTFFIYHYQKKTILAVSYDFISYSQDRMIGAINRRKLPTASSALNSYLEKFLQQNSTIHSGSVMLISQRGKIIINTRPNSVIHNNADGYRLDREAVRKAYLSYQKQKKPEFMMKFNNNNYLVAFKLFSLDGQTRWLLGYIIPYNLLSKSIYSSSEYLLIFSMGMLLIGIILITFAARKVSYSIVKLTHTANRLREFKFDNLFQDESRIKEVNMLSQSLYALGKSMQSFSKYVSKDLVKQLYQAGQVAKPSSTKKQMTVMFTDIVNFSRLAREVPSEELSSLLSGYFSELTQIIKQHHGTIDKFIGDAMMAFWGAPLDDSNHIINACNAALLCKHKISEINSQHQKQGKPLLPTRFGLNAGDVVVGNMGSLDHLNYTVVGENVNLAARLEVINKRYGTTILISDSVYQAIQAYFLCRPVDMVNISGQSQLVQVYELIAAREDTIASSIIATPLESTWCELILNGYIAYLEHDYSSALKQYQAALELCPEDELSALYIQRCQKLIS